MGRVRVSIRLPSAHPVSPGAFSGVRWVIEWFGWLGTCKAPPGQLLQGHLNPELGAQNPKGRSGMGPGMGLLPLLRGSLGRCLTKGCTLGVLGREGAWCIGEAKCNTDGLCMLGHFWWSAVAQLSGCAA